MQLRFVQSCEDNDSMSLRTSPLDAEQPDHGRWSVVGFLLISDWCCRYIARMAERYHRSIGADAAEASSIHVSLRCTQGTPPTNQPWVAMPRRGDSTLVALPPPSSSKRGPCAVTFPATNTLFRHVGAEAGPPQPRAEWRLGSCGPCPVPVVLDRERDRGVVSPRTVVAVVSSPRGVIQGQNTIPAENATNAVEDGRRNLRPSTRRHVCRSTHRGDGGWRERNQRLRRRRRAISLSRRGHTPMDGTLRSTYLGTGETSVPRIL